MYNMLCCVCVCVTCLTCVVCITCLITFCVYITCCLTCCAAPAGLVVGDPERLGGGAPPRGPGGDPLHGEQLRGQPHPGEGVHEGGDEDQGGRLSGTD